MGPHYVTKYAEKGDNSGETDKMIAGYNAVRQWALALLYSAVIRFNKHCQYFAAWQRSRWTFGKMAAAKINRRKWGIT